MSVKVISGEAAFDAAIASGRVLVKLGADHRCPPCRAVAPVLPKLHSDFGIQVVDVNVDLPENAFVRERFGRNGVPHMFFFCDGTNRGDHLGFTNYPEVRAWLENTMRASGLTVPEPSDAERQFAQTAADFWRNYQEAMKKAKSHWATLETRVDAEFSKAKQAADSSLAAHEMDSGEHEAALVQAMATALQDGAQAYAAYAALYARYVQELSSLCAEFMSTTVQAAA